jgi:hypothetical protein
MTKAFSAAAPHRPIVARVLSLCALGLLAHVLAPMPAQAQLFGLWQPAYPPLVMRPRAPMAHAMGPTHPMPPAEVAHMLRNYGFRALGRIEPRGDAYQVAALDRAGVPVTIVLDAYDGDILDVFARRSVNAPVAPQPGLAGSHPKDPRSAVPLPPVRPVIATLAPAPAINPPNAPAAPIYPPPEAEALRGLAKR